MTWKISSHGAARTVTGSSHLVEFDNGGPRILLDCGLFQGGKKLEGLNSQGFGFKPEMLDATVLSHAHLDHAGRLPLLSKHGFAGPIFATDATRRLIEYLLLDAAKLQREDFERAKRKGQDAPEPLYDEDDVARTLAQVEPLERGLEIDGVRVSTQVAGHIPGSRSIILEAGGQRLVFSGDLGNVRKEVLPDAPACPEANVVLCESTYGDREHKPYEATIEELAQILRTAAERGGKILIPSFALERTQDLLFQIRRLEEEKRVPVLPVFVDSPLASKMQRVYNTYLEEFSDEVQAIARTGQNPFEPTRLSFTASSEESKALNVLKGPAVILAGAGMLTGGRILHHLKLNLSDPKTSVLIVGFQPEGGLGRLLIDGANHVRILGEEVRVNASVHTVGGFSAHADQRELMDWLGGAGKNSEVRLVHGEVAAMEVLQSKLRERGQRASLMEPAFDLPGGGHSNDGE